MIEKVYDFTPSRIATHISTFFSAYLNEHEIGYVTGASGGYILTETDIFIPDVGYISKTRLPEMPALEAPVPPDLAVEVKTQKDWKRTLRYKAERYLEMRTQVVWLVFPDEQVAEVYVLDEDVQTIGIDGVLDGGDLLPGFTLAVREIFGVK